MAAEIMRGGGKRNWLRLFFSLVLVGTGVAMVPGQSLAADTDVSWTDDGVAVWRFDSDHKVWVDSPGALEEDPNIYKFEYLCLDDGRNNFDVRCLNAAVECTDGENGRPVRWYSALKAFRVPVWSQIRPDRCVYTEDPSDVLGRIAAQIQSKFEQLPVKAGTSGVQPSPHTLRGAETNFYAEASEQSFSVNMLGQSVAIVAKPVQYRWEYGDGRSLGPTTTMGGPLPQDRWGEKTRTSHAYAATGDFSVVLTTYFQGTYSVNGGPALPIPNQGQFSSRPQTVSVWRSVTRNYADDCNTNPQGEGCPAASTSKGR